MKQNFTDHITREVKGVHKKNKMFVKHKGGRAKLKTRQRKKVRYIKKVSEIKKYTRPFANKNGVYKGERVSIPQEKAIKSIKLDGNRNKF